MYKKFKNLDFLRISLIVLSLLAIVKAVTYLSTNRITNNGSFEISDNDAQRSIITIPIFSTNPVELNKEVVIDSRQAQIQKINSFGVIKLFSDNSIFSRTKNDLSWIYSHDPQETKNQKLPDNRSLMFSLLNPFLLVSPQILPSDKLQALDILNSKLFNLRDLYFDPNRNEAGVTMGVYPQFSPRQLKSSLSMIAHAFNAFDLGFSFSQEDRVLSSNIVFADGIEEVMPTKTLFLPLPCQLEETETENLSLCNLPVSSLGTFSFAVKQLPARAQFQLWKKDPRIENTDSTKERSTSFIIKFEEEFL